MCTNRADGYPSLSICRITHLSTYSPVFNAKPSCTEPPQHVHDLRRRRGGERYCAKMLPGQRKLFGQWNAIYIPPRVMARVRVMIGSRGRVNLLRDHDELFVPLQVISRGNAPWREIRNSASCVYRQHVSTSVARGREIEIEELPGGIPTTRGIRGAQRERWAAFQRIGGENILMFVIRSLSWCHDPAAVGRD